MDTSAITDVTPMMMPSVVSTLRSLLAVSARRATLMFSMNMLFYSRVTFDLRQTSHVNVIRI